ncbi:GlxA family transcriptional regulator [Thalassospira sp.]|uniref:GlxA family transcriptional regulator n=1 Tax=Thalassospira sp. TaxID=1912094 RepID=UPI002735682D|nr:GlxA family transcriptional regulator [Thalassospira sp.]MDP2697467.1 GlxA family transcriptional regulator [Thalassospira sp.]
MKSEKLSPATVLSVGFVLARKFTLGAFGNFVDVLRLSADEGDRSRPIRCRWAVLGRVGEAVPSSSGITVQATEAFGDPARFDYIVVVGGLLDEQDPLSDAARGFIRQAAAQNVPLVGVCTGSFLLCRAGVMTGYGCCVSWFHHHDFIAEFPDVTPVADRLFVVDRDRITCSGGMGAVDLAAWLVERHVSRMAAQKSLHIMQVAAARTGDDAQPAPPVIPQGIQTVRDARVKRALVLMEQNMAPPLDMPTLAGRLDIGVRQLERLFLRETGAGPAQSYVRLRVMTAVWILDHSRRDITDIAMETGFADASHFIRHFKRLIGMTPAAWRVRHRPGVDGVQSAGDVGSLPDRRIFVTPT